MAKKPCVYILSNRKNGAMYVGVSANLTERIHTHKQNKPGSFSAKYSIVRLVHVEFFETMIDAITREKQIKNWKRGWKVNLIEQDNPDWNDLYERIN